MTWVQVLLGKRDLLVLSFASPHAIPAVVCHGSATRLRLTLLADDEGERVWRHATRCRHSNRDPRREVAGSASIKVAPCRGNLALDRG